jgi:hypothetical protein
VTLYDGVTVLGTTALSGTSATLSTSGLPSGAQSVIARYLGDANFTPSLSRPFRQAVASLPQNGFQPEVLDVGAVGGTFSALVVGDFNGDGKPDIALAYLEFAQVAVSIGNGDGTFQGPIITPIAGASPFSMALGDFNGDGKSDLVVADAGNDRVFLLLGNGNGTFQTPVPYPMGPSPEFVAVADFNGYGYADIITTSRSYNAVTLRLGKGDGTFQPPMGFTAGAQALVPSLAIGDFNGDGIPDLALALFYGTGGNLMVLVGNGDGTFTQGASYPIAGEGLIVAVGDFNGDGKADLAITNSNPNVDAGAAGLAVLLGNGDGTFQPAVGYAAGFAPNPMVVGDFNGDGKSDLAVVDLTSTPSYYTPSNLKILLGNGDGTFQPAVTTSISGIGSLSPTLAVADFNRDGRTDLAMALDCCGHDFGIVLGNPVTTPAAITLATNPSGLLVSVDGAAALVAPFTLELAPGTHTVAVSATQAGAAGTQYALSGWSDSGTASHSIIVEAAPATYTATFKTQYQLTASTSPAAGGAVTPASGFLDAGTVVGIQAFANAGYVFANFSSGLTGAANPQNVTMSAPVRVVANFTPLSPNLAASVGARVDGVPGVTRLVTLTLTNTGLAAATNATIVSITGTSDVAGSGTVTMASGTPADLGTIAPGASASGTVTFDWPATATRVKFTVNFTADGGYTGSSTITTIR